MNSFAVFHILNESVGEDGEDSRQEKENRQTGVHDGDLQPAVCTLRFGFGTGYDAYMKIIG